MHWNFNINIYIIMEKEKRIYKHLISLRFPEHKFRDSNAIFHKGFKFELSVDKQGNETYSSFNTRKARYVKLSDVDLDLIIENGIYVASDILSYKDSIRKKIINERLLSESNAGYKMMIMINKKIKTYTDKCEELLIKNKEHSGLFV